MALLEVYIVLLNLVNRQCGFSKHQILLVFLKFINAKTQIEVNAVKIAFFI